MEMLADTMKSTSQPIRVRCLMEKTAMVTLFMSISKYCLFYHNSPYLMFNRMQLTIAIHQYYK